MYTINYLGTIIRIADNASIPPDTRNIDYVEYLEWVARGNIAPIDPPPVPTPFELRPADAQIHPRMGKMDPGRAADLVERQFGGFYCGWVFYPDRREEHAQDDQRVD